LLSRLTDLLRAVVRRPGRTAARPRPAGPKPSPTPVDRADSPGRSGPSATVEIDPGRVGTVRMTYSPDRDGAPDPGEIVWTWVPFEERDGRGKDRPVLVVAAEPTGSYLAVQLTSKQHQDADFVAVGSGAWDSTGRPSWVNVDRVFRVHAGGMRRETAGLPAPAFAAVTARLRERYGWR
jgi:hypothetical protein